MVFSNVMVDQLSFLVASLCSVSLVFKFLRAYLTNVSGLAVAAFSDLVNYPCLTLSSPLTKDDELMKEGNGKRHFWILLEEISCQNSRSF